MLSRNTWQPSVASFTHADLRRGPRARPRQPPRVSQVLLTQSTCSLRTPLRDESEMAAVIPARGDLPKRARSHVVKHSLVGAAKGHRRDCGRRTGHCWALFSSPASCKCATLPSPRAPALPSPPTRSFPVPFPAPRVAQVLVMTVYLQSVYSRRRISDEAVERWFAPL